MEEDYFKMDLRERRRFKRHILDNPLKYSSSEEDQFKDAHTIDASEGGLMFTSKEDVKKGSLINLQMPLDNKTYKIKARVARVVFDEKIGQYRVGVEFTDYTESFRINLKIKLVNVLVATTVFSSAFFGGTPEGAAQQAHPAAITQPAVPAQQLDMESLECVYSEEALKKLAASGASYVTICITRFMDSHTSTDIKITDSTMSDKETISAIKKAGKFGLKVLLKPRIGIINNLDDTYTSADIGFSSESDWVKWFSEYSAYISHYAEIAKKTGVDIFCVGTELSFTTQREDKWKDIIAGARKLYNGKLVYASKDDNFTNIAFWKDLDYIGIEAGNPSGQLPSVEDMKAIWDKWHSTIVAIQLALNKPVILTNWMV